METGLRTTTAYQANSDINMKIELLTKKDAPCVAKIEQECFSTPFKESDILEYLDNPIWHFYVAKDEKEVLGYISFTVILDECQIVNVATSPAYRKMGVGKALIGKMLGYAKENGISKVFLEVRESNAPAIGLYKSFGFYAAGISKNHYSQPSENALLMNLEI